MEIMILLENNSVDAQLETKHGLSVFIKYRGKNILLDTGPDNKFIKNAKKLNADLTKIDLVFLSHSHYDHTGGLNAFFKMNKNPPPVYLMDKVSSRYYKKQKFFNISIGLKMSKKYNSKITQLDNDLIIDNSIYFFRNTVSDNVKPASNSKLFKKENKNIIPDTFDHEGILVLEENGELAIFNSCSHNGLLNIIGTVEAKIPGKKIRCYTGGLHLSNPGTKQHDNEEYLDMLAEKIIKKGITLYTGHCTGRYALEYMKKKLDSRMREINTGMRLNI